MQEEKKRIEEGDARELWALNYLTSKECSFSFKKKKEGESLEQTYI